MVHGVIMPGYKIESVPMMLYDMEIPRACWDGAVEGREASFTERQR